MARVAVLGRREESAAGVPSSSSWAEDRLPHAQATRHRSTIELDTDGAKNMHEYCCEVLCDEF